MSNEPLKWRKKLLWNHQKRYLTPFPPPEVAPWGARLVHWTNIYLFSLNLAWMTTTYNAASWDMTHHQPLSDRRLLSLWFLYQRIEIPAPPIAFFMLAWAFALSLPVFLILFLMARTSLARNCLRAFAGAFAIVGYPFFALFSTDWVFGSLRIPRSELGLFLEAVAVLAFGVLYYLRRWPFSTRASVLLLLVHFGLWAWVTRCCGNPYTELQYSDFFWREGGRVVTGIKIWLAISLSSMFLYSFPGIGFLSALSSGLDIRLSSGRPPHAVDLSVAKPVA